MSGIVVKNAGVFTLIQDSGRFGFSDIGVTQSGAMDKYSYNLLNQLFNNEKDTNALEIVFGNLKLVSDVQSFIALTGAKCEFSINGKKKQNWMVHKINVGDRIKIGKILEGQRVYLGVKGGFKIPKELGSVSTTIKEKIGAFGGDRVKNDSFLECESCENLPLKRVKDEFIPKYTNELVLHVILGYQEENFSKKEKEKFFNSQYEITSQVSRMGYKLKGATIKQLYSGIISEGISYGAIQIPKDGQPIILLNDRQTIGGYPKIGTVLPSDCYKLSQMKVGAKIKFQEISLDEAIIKEKEFIVSFS